MASSRRSGTSENVSTYGSGGRDYTALGTWESATDNNLVTSTTSEVLEVYDDSASYNDQVTIAGATTNSTYFRIIRAETESRPKGIKSTGAVFSSTADSDVFVISESNFKLQDVNITASITSASTRHAVRITSTVVDVVGVFIYDLVNSGSGAFDGIGLEAAECNIVNCIIDAANLGIESTATGGTRHDIYNCTVVNGSSIGYLHADAEFTELAIKNCIGDNNTSFDFFVNAEGNSTNNSSSDTSSPGGSDRDSQTFTFVSANDFHLQSGDAGAKNFGADLSSDTQFAFDDDIDFQTRPDATTWDIGADEEGASEASASSSGLALLPMLKVGL